MAHQFQTKDENKKENQNQGKQKFDFEGLTEEEQQNKTNNQRIVLYSQDDMNVTQFFENLANYQQENLNRAQRHVYYGNSDSRDIVCILDATTSIGIDFYGKGRDLSKTADEIKKSFKDFIENESWRDDLNITVTITHAGKIIEVFFREPIKEVQKKGANLPYQLIGGLRFYDAAYETVKKIAEAKDKSNNMVPPLVVFVSDEDICSGSWEKSQNHKESDLKKLIDELSGDEGWEFVLIAANGADQNLITGAANIGIPGTHVLKGNVSTFSERFSALHEVILQMEEREMKMNTDENYEKEEIVIAGALEAPKANENYGGFGGR